MILIWVSAAFVSGSLMFSHWLGLIVRQNLRAVGDGNPGAVNLWKSAGYKLGMAGIVLDFLKGYIPAFLLAKSGYVHVYEIVPIALAPVVGHAFSPFLKFRGGKSIAVTFGVWSGLTRFEASLVYAVILAALLLIGRALNKGRPTTREADGFQVVLGMLFLTVYLYISAFPTPIVWLSVGNLALLAYTHRRELGAYVKRRQSNARKHDSHFKA